MQLFHSRQLPTIYSTTTSVLLSRVLHHSHTASFAMRSYHCRLHATLAPCPHSHADKYCYIRYYCCCLPACSTYIATLVACAADASPAAARAARALQSSSDAPHCPIAYKYAILACGGSAGTSSEQPLSVPLSMLAEAERKGMAHAGVRNAALLACARYVLLDLLLQTVPCMYVWRRLCICQGDDCQRANLWMFAAVA
jgi:hypothetical protein